MTTFTSKEQLTRKMKLQITSSDAQSLKALKRIYEFQTAQEKKIGDTCEYNGVGFNGHDAKVLKGNRNRYRCLLPDEKPCTYSCYSA